jgi:hypothetical protein
MASPAGVIASIDRVRLAVCNLTTVQEKILETQQSILLLLQEQAVRVRQVD